MVFEGFKKAGHVQTIQRGELYSVAFEVSFICVYHEQLSDIAQQ
jgi:hypothetical protein